MKKLLLVIAFLVSISVFSKEPKYEVITLEKNNTVSLNYPVMSEFMDKVKYELLTKSWSLNKDDTIYIFVDTPGGSIIEGLKLINLMKAIPQKVVTISQYSASMGFIIVQNSDKRYILPNGIMMSHPATVSIGGQIPGEVNSRLKFINQLLFIVDRDVSERLNLSINTYRKKIKDEMWLIGEEAIKNKAADKIVLVKCGESLNTVTKQNINTFVGKVIIYWSDCPLIDNPVKIDYSNITIPVTDYRYQLLVNTIYRITYGRRSIKEKELIKNREFQEVFGK